MSGVVMDRIVDLDRWMFDGLAYPYDQALIEACRQDLAAKGMCNLEGFLREEARARIVDELLPVFAHESYRHERRHNIYFKRAIEGLPPDFPVLAEFETSNDTICADQIAGSALLDLYHWKTFQDFIAHSLGLRKLFAMDDPLAAVNVMSYGPGQSLNWHFDRSEFTVTLLLQAAETGGDFQYSKDLRSDDNPNYSGVLRLLQGEDENMRTLRLTPGTLSIFRGRNTPHRVTQVGGDTRRLIAVLSYFETPGVRFTPEEQLGFYGRSA